MAYKNYSNGNSLSTYTTTEAEKKVCILPRNLPFPTQTLCPSFISVAVIT